MYLSLYVYLWKWIKRENKHCKGTRSVNAFRWLGKEANRYQDREHEEKPLRIKDVYRANPHPEGLLWLMKESTTHPVFDARPEIAYKAQQTCLLVSRGISHDQDAAPTRSARIDMK